MEKVEEGNTDHPPGLSLNGDQNQKTNKKDTSRGHSSIYKLCYRCSPVYIRLILHVIHHNV